MCYLVVILQSLLLLFIPHPHAALVALCLPCSLQDVVVLELGTNALSELSHSTLEEVILL